MKKIIALLVTAFVAASVYAANSFPEISVKDVNALVGTKAAVIIDVNGTESFNTGHIPGALNYDAIQSKLAAKLPKDKNALIVAYCGNPKCKAYLEAANAAQKLGYTNVKHMTAGIAGWKDAGMKTEQAK
jgi:rhodanese-related sulfurtransferase